MKHHLHLKQRGRGQPVPVRGTWCREKPDDPARVDQPAPGVTVGRAGSSHLLPPTDKEQDRGLFKQEDILLLVAGGLQLGATLLPCHHCPQASQTGEKCCCPPSSFSSPLPDTTGISPHSRAYPGTHPDQHLPDRRGPGGGGVHPGSGCPLWLPGLQGGKAEEKEEGS